MSERNIERIVKKYADKNYHIIMITNQAGIAKGKFTFEGMEEGFEGQDVVFVLIADESSPAEEWSRLITQMKGHHYRLSTKQMHSLMQKWNLTEFPSYVIFGKDGAVKDVHSIFKGVDYYKNKIDELLK